MRSPRDDADFAVPIRRTGALRRRGLAVVALIAVGVPPPASAQDEVSIERAFKSVGDTVVVCGWADKIDRSPEIDAVLLSVSATGARREAGRSVGEPFVIQAPSTVMPLLHLEVEPDVYVCATGQVRGNGPPHLVAEHESIERALGDSELTELPERIHYVAPKPDGRTLRQVGGGSVELRAVIDPSGTVRDVRIRKGLHPTLDRTAVEAVEQWRYTPPLLHGKPVRLKLTVTVRWDLGRP